MMDYDEVPLCPSCNDAENEKWNRWVANEFLKMYGPKKAIKKIKQDIALIERIEEVIK